MSNDPSKSYGIFEQKIREVLDKEAPMKTYQLRNNYKPWVRDETKTDMSDRDRLRDRARKSQLPSNWQEYKALRNIFTSKLRKDKDDYFKRVYGELDRDRDIANMYKLTRQQPGWTKCSSPESFLVDGKRVSSPALMAEIQMDVFNTKVKKLIESLPRMETDPLSSLRKALERWGDKAKSRPEFNLSEITLSQTAELISQLGNSKSSGIDELDAMSLKLAASCLLKPINFIINQSKSLCVSKPVQNCETVAIAQEQKFM